MLDTRRALWLDRFGAAGQREKRGRSSALHQSPRLAGAAIGTLASCRWLTRRAARGDAERVRSPARLFGWARHAARAARSRGPTSATCSAVLASTLFPPNRRLPGTLPWSVLGWRPLGAPLEPATCSAAHPSFAAPAPKGRRVPRAPRHSARRAASRAMRTPARGADRHRTRCPCSSSSGASLPLDALERRIAT